MVKVENRPAILLLGIWLVATSLLWALAFFPAPGTAPEWLVSARNACFGSMEDGLPGPAGWMILILSPLSLLAAAWTAWNLEIRSGLRELARGVTGRSVLLIVAATVAWEGAWVAAKIRTGIQLANADFRAEANGDLPPGYPRADRPAPPLDLVDQAGARISLGSFSGKAVVLTFAFAHCTTICPAIVEQSKQALAGLDESRVSLLVVTLDPWRDTPRSLPSLARKWNLPANAHVLSGEVPMVTRVLDDFQIPWKRDEKNGDIAHPALTYVISPEGRIAYAFNNAPPRWLAQAASRLVAAREN